MRVAYVCTDPGVPVFGQKGCSVHVQSILREMIAAGYQVELFARRLGGAPPDELVNVRVHTLAPVVTRVAGEREQALAAGNRELRLLLERRGPFDLVYERYALWSCAAMQFAADSQTPSVLEINAPLVREQATHRQLVDRQGADRLSAAACRSASVLLAVSNGVADQICADFALHDDPRLEVVPNGVTPDRFAPTRHEILSRLTSSGLCDEFVIGFVGTLRPWHGMETLGAAFSCLHQSLPHARLLVVGDGSARSQLELALTPAARPAVTVTGAVDHADVPRWMSRMDVGVAPYLDADNFYFSPLKVMEYLAAGLPTVCSSASTFGSLLNPTNALFFTAGDALQLAGVLRQLHDDRSLRRRLAEAAYRSLQPHHTWTGVLQEACRLAGAAPRAFEHARQVG